MHCVCVPLFLKKLLIQVMMQLFSDTAVHNNMHVSQGLVHCMQTSIRQHLLTSLHEVVAEPNHRVTVCSLLVVYPKN